MFKWSLIFLLLPLLATAQLKEFEVGEMKRQDVAVVQANTQFSDDALLLVYSSLKDLNFRSSLGGIDKVSYNLQSNRYEILFKPNKQMLFVYASNFIEQKIETFNPNPKDVFYYKVEEKQKTVVNTKPGTLKIVTEPSGADVFVNGSQQFQKTPFTAKLNPGVTPIELKKNEYEAISTTVQIVSDAPTFVKFKMNPTKYWIVIGEGGKTVFDAKTDTYIDLKEGQRIDLTQYLEYLIGDTLGIHFFPKTKTIHNEYGEKYHIVRSYSGGAHCCQETEIFVEDSGSNHLIRIAKLRQEGLINEIEYPLNIRLGGDYFYSSYAQWIPLTCDSNFQVKGAMRGTEFFMFTQGSKEDYLTCFTDYLLSLDVPDLVGTLFPQDNGERELILRGFEKLNIAGVPQDELLEIYSELLNDFQGKSSLWIEILEWIGTDSLTLLRHQKLLNEKSKCIDPAGRQYKTVMIGSQIWMAEDLAYAAQEGDYWTYENDSLLNVGEYGFMYDWETALNVCPDGWHLPSSKEWGELIVFLGGKESAGITMKNNIGWNQQAEPNKQSEFFAIPSGVCDSTGVFRHVGLFSSWWASTEYSDPDFGMHWYVTRGLDDVKHSYHAKKGGMPVRCLLD